MIKGWGIYNKLYKKIKLSIILIIIRGYFIREKFNCNGFLRLLINIGEYKLDNNGIYNKIMYFILFKCKLYLIFCNIKIFSEDNVMFNLIKDF